MIFVTSDPRLEWPVCHFTLQMKCIVPADVSQRQQLRIQISGFHHQTIDPPSNRHLYGQESKFWDVERNDELFQGSWTTTTITNYTTNKISVSKVHIYDIPSASGEQVSYSTEFLTFQHTEIFFNSPNKSVEYFVPIQITKDEIIKGLHINLLKDMMDVLIIQRNSSNENVHIQLSLPSTPVPLHQRKIRTIRYQAFHLFQHDLRKYQEYILVAIPGPTFSLGLRLVDSSIQQHKTVRLSKAPFHLVSKHSLQDYFNITKTAVHFYNHTKNVVYHFIQFFKWNITVKPLSWEEAMFLCNKYGEKLPTFHNRRQQDELIALLKLPPPYVEALFIGLNKR